VGRNFLVCTVLVLSILAATGAVFAHHASGSAFDYKMKIVTKAVVTELVWSNPHAQLYFDVKNDKGEVMNWGVELNSPGNLIKNGWTKNTFKPGDEIVVQFVPSKEERPYGTCGDFVKADGKKYHNGQGCGTDITKLPVKPGYPAVSFPE
jgi:Family of unknown function (DUF6152)